jgi:hypothetical protein
MWRLQCSVSEVVEAVEQVKDAAHGRRPILLPGHLVEPATPL